MNIIIDMLTTFMLTFFVVFAIFRPLVWIKTKLEQRPIRGFLFPLFVFPLVPLLGVMFGIKAMGSHYIDSDEAQAILFYSMFVFFLSIKPAFWAFKLQSKIDKKG